jgi:gamma-glutamylcyclotransferase (GGCT)/AIG2-like uncharacterized protein YtfP
VPLVFQYGSNCNAERFNHRSRLNGDAVDLGAARTVANYEIAFNKWSKNASCAAADLLKPRIGGRRIWGVLYKVSRAGFKKLKHIEGPAYRPQRVEVEDAKGATRTVTTFRVRRARRQNDLHTSFEYVAHIVRGLRKHDATEEYVAYVINVAQETNRHGGTLGPEQGRLIERLRNERTLG